MYANLLDQQRVAVHENGAVNSLEEIFRKTRLRVLFSCSTQLSMKFVLLIIIKKGKRKVQGKPRSQTAALPRHQEDEETDKAEQAQIEQTYEKH